MFAAHSTALLFFLNDFSLANLIVSSREKRGKITKAACLQQKTPMPRVLRTIPRPPDNPCSVWKQSRSCRTSYALISHRSH